MKPFTMPQLLTTLEVFEKNVVICTDVNRAGHTSKPYLVFDGGELYAVHAHETSALGEARKLVAWKQDRA